MEVKKLWLTRADSLLVVEADPVMIQPSRELWAIGSRGSPFFSPGRMMVGYSSAPRTQSIREGLQ